MAALSEATEVYQAFLEGHRAYPDDEQIAADLDKARAAMEVAWLENLADKRPAQLPEYVTLLGDAAAMLRTLEAATIDAVVTSPPYAEQRKGTYDGVSEADYPDWTVEWFKALRHALKPEGSVILNIRPHVRNGQISDYVLRTRLAVRAAGWVELDEMIWRKTTAPPLGHNRRPRRSWESLLWFGTTGNAHCDPKANGRASTDVGFGGSRARQHGWTHLHGGQRHNTYHAGIARCIDVAEFAPARDADHPAPFPVDLARWCIRLTCPPGGTVLDPFMGSGTTGVAAKSEGRSFVGIDNVPAYVEMARRRVADG